MFGVIKDNKLVGLYHNTKHCPRLHKELRKSKGEVHIINRNIKKSNRYYCRFCIYIEAEELGINCFDICPQRVCLKTDKIPEQMKREMLCQSNVQNVQ